MERSEKEWLRRGCECPSFSSTLLDLIYRSIDESDDAGGAGAEHSPVAVLRRPLPPSKVRTLARPRRLPHVSASSSSDNSGFGGFSSSSEPDSSASRRPRIRPIRTLPPPSRSAAAAARQRPPPPLPRPPPRPTQCAASPPAKHHRGRARSCLIRPKLRDLGRSKAPASPGSRFVSLLNSLFANAAGKQRKSKPSTVNDSACYAASTRSRPCLVKTPLLSRQGTASDDEGVKRSVRFHPVSVIMGEEVLPCRKNIPYAGERAAAARAEDRIRAAAVAEGIARRKVDKMLRSLEVEEEEEEEDDEDEKSDSSSDLFELENLTVNGGGGGGGYTGELPVYNTTRCPMTIIKIMK